MTGRTADAADGTATDGTGAGGTDGAAGCGGHPGLVGELRALLVTALDRLQPALDRLRPDPSTPDSSTPDGATPDGAAAEHPDGARTAPDGPEPAATSAPCAICPLCVLIAAVRGERPELAARLATQASGLLAVLRAALDEGVGAPPPAAPEPAGPAPTARRVQRIPVHRG